MHADIKEGRVFVDIKAVGVLHADIKEGRGVACRYKGGEGCCMQI